MKFPFLKTTQGKWSTTNITLFILFLVGLIEIWRPFIPPQYQPFEVPVVATLMFIIRTWFSSGDPIQKSL